MSLNDGYCMDIIRKTTKARLDEIHKITGKNHSDIIDKLLDAVVLPSDFGVDGSKINLGDFI